MNTFVCTFGGKMPTLFTSGKAVLYAYLRLGSKC